MVDELKTGIYSYVSSSPFFMNYLTGGMYGNEYPQNTTKVVYPNIIYHWINNTNDRDSHGYFESINIQFNIYTDEDTEVNSKAGSDLMDFLVDQLTTLMDDAVLTVDGYGNIKTIRNFSHPIPKMNEDRVWGWAIEYQILLEKI